VRALRFLLTEARGEPALLLPRVARRETPAVNIAPDNLSGLGDGADNERAIRVSEQRLEQAVILAVDGDVDMLTAPRLDEALTAAVEQKPATVVVDLTRVDFLASAGLAVLAGAMQRCDEQTTIKVVATQRAVLRPLQITGLDSQFQVCSSQSEALGAP
jgi:anti-sigma B factor antagonist